MSQNTVNRLKKANWFDELPEDMLTALAQKVSERALSKDEVLFNKGDEGDSLFIIFDGQVKVITHDEDGNEITLNKVSAGEIIGEMALLDHETRSAGIVALEKTSTLELKREDFMEVLKGHPDLALSVIRNLSKRLRHNTSYIEKITELSRRVAGGDYSVINEPQPEQTDEKKGSEQEKVAQLMAEFITMVREIREREEDLRNQVQKLSLQIDEPQRKQAFEEITSTDFYANLKEQAKILRAKRKDKKDGQ
jgi:CRP/FNR family transcriptional regulator, cyclic AMP receptor protein